MTVAPRQPRSRLTPAVRNLPPELLPDLFTRPWRSARRIEVRRGYASDTADPRWAQVARGEPPVYDPGRPWHRLIAGIVGQGRAVQRIRVVDDPLTAGQRYLAVTGVHNCRAGEQIRLVSRTRADALGLAADMWWFRHPDGDSVATLRFDDADALVGVSVAYDPELVGGAAWLWSAAWPEAIELTACLPV